MHEYDAGKVHGKLRKPINLLKLSIVKRDAKFRWT